MPKRLTTFSQLLKPQREKIHRAVHEQDRKFLHSSAWQKLRALKLSINPVCEACLKTGRATVATDVHHLKERRTNPELALTLENLQSLCHACHSRITGQTHGGKN